jgi:hypothetical protein
MNKFQRNKGKKKERGEWGPNCCFLDELVLPGIIHLKFCSFSICPQDEDETKSV